MPPLVDRLGDQLGNCRAMDTNEKTAKLLAASKERRLKKATSSQHNRSSKKVAAQEAARKAAAVFIPANQRVVAREAVFIRPRNQKVNMNGKDEAKTKPTSQSNGTWKDSRMQLDISSPAAEAFVQNSLSISERQRADYEEWRRTAEQEGSDTKRRESFQCCRADCKGY